MIEQKIATLSRLGDVEIRQAEGSEEITVVLHIEWEKWDKWDRNSYTGKATSLEEAIDQVVEKVIKDLQVKNAVAVSKAQKYDRMFRQTKYRLKQQGDWDRLFHPDHYKGVQEGTRKPTPDDPSVCPACYESLDKDGKCPRMCDT